ncbi:AI-2E family transporter [Salinarimonas soli]|uniref:AI-2E family transporter n=1 Tax=Salinarimonas soli TaxID=1638099 RepID=A0A5B2VZ45_9HYPH|nr:AI-2E family transporter [Salinarimonas soli]KAA2244305.1 AI-2E family transporter [Salinarimonas soli]
MADRDEAGAPRRAAKVVTPATGGAAPPEPRPPTVDTDPPARDAHARVSEPVALDRAGPGGTPSSSEAARRMPDAPPQGSTPAALTWRERFKTDWEFLRRVLMVLGVVALAYLVWSITYVLLLVFAAVLIAVALRAFAAFLAHRVHVPQRWSLLAAILAVLVIVVAIGTLFGAQMRGQLTVVTERLPLALTTFGKEFGIDDLAGQLPEMVSGSGTTVVRQVAGLGYTLVGALADMLLVIVAAIYIASDPKLYRRGLVKLFPKSQHPRVEDSLEAVGNGLTLWFYAQLISMLLVGGLSILAYWFIGLPGALALGVIAGLTNFIPLLGPVIGAVPAVLISFTAGGNAVLWTLAAALVIQQIEGNVIMPIVEKKAVQLPPALALFAILAAGLVFGFIGVFLAVPITVMAFILVKKLYVRQTLGESTPVPGEDERGPSVDEARIAGLKG